MPCEEFHARVTIDSVSPLPDWARPHNDEITSQTAEVEQDAISDLSLTVPEWFLANNVETTTDALVGKSIIERWTTEMAWLSTFPTSSCPGTVSTELDRLPLTSGESRRLNNTTLFHHP